MAWRFLKYQKMKSMAEVIDFIVEDIKKEVLNCLKKTF